MSDLARRLAAELTAAGVTSETLRPLVERHGASWLAQDANDAADIEAQVEALLANNFGGFGFDFIREWAGFYCRA